MASKVKIERPRRANGSPEVIRSRAPPEKKKKRNMIENVKNFF